MTKIKIQSERDCRDSRKVERFARSNGCEIRETGGSHFRMSFKGEHETAYRHGHDDISNGVAHKIWKFFIKCGFISICIYQIAQLLS